MPGVIWQLLVLLRVFLIYRFCLAALPLGCAAKAPSEAVPNAK